MMNKIMSTHIFNTLVWLSAIIAIVVTIDPLENGHNSMKITKKFPYLVGLAAADGYGNINQTVCLGTLVSPNFVLTSAFCTTLLQTGKIRVFSKKSETTIKRHLAVKVFTHPSYDPSRRLFDLSLVKLKKPFKHVNRFVRLSSKQFNHDKDMDCKFIAINASTGVSYQIPVRVKYGRSACQIPKYNPIFKYILGYTWTDFLCTQTIGPVSKYLPCGRSDPLLCRNKQYGIFSYGYNINGNTSSESISPMSNESGPVECSDPTMQSRSLFINKHYKWITKTISGNVEDKILVNVETKKISMNTSINNRRSNVTMAIKPTSTYSTPTNSVESVPNFSSGPDDYPYLVHLQGLADEPTCGGTLISPIHVLTSAYCTTRMTNIHVTATNQRHLHTNADIVYVHPDFDVETLTADVSIVILHDPFNVSKYAEIADFSEPSGVNETSVMSCAIVAKLPTAPYYYHASVKAKYGPKACWKASVSEIQTTIDQTWHEFICGLSENRLKDDTGNPLICNGMQYGVISHAYQITHPNANITEQMRFLTVKNYKLWITNVVTEIKHQEVEGKGVKNHRCGLAMVIIVVLLSNMF